MSVERLPSAQLAANRRAIEFLEDHVAQARHMLMHLREDACAIEGDIEAMETALSTLRAEWPPLNVVQMKESNT